MRRQFLFSTVIAAAMAVGVGAQQSSPSGYQSSQSSSDKAVSVTGCVERGTGGATGTTGSTAGGATAGSTSSSGQFVLKNVMAGSSSTAGSTTGTTGSSASSLPSSATTQGLKLIASASDDLDKYVGKKVEVKGTIEKAGSESSTTAGSTAGSTAAGSTAGSTGSMSSGASSQGNMASLRVTSIQETSGTCSGGQK
jgi:hypothetical protein